jgi:hypothetical protein
VYTGANIVNIEMGSDFGSASGGISINPSSWYENGNIIHVLAGRTAIDVIIRDIKITSLLRTVYMPSYCCESMIEPFVKNGVSVVFYHVTAGAEGFSIDYDFNNNCDAIVLLDYFGYSNHAVQNIAKRESQAGKVVIYDGSHKLNGNRGVSQVATYEFCSYRKWFYTNTAVVKKKNPFSLVYPTKQYDGYCDARNRAAMLKAGYLAGTVADNQEFLALFHSAQEMLDANYEGYAAELITPENRSVVDIAALKKQRQINAAHLISGLRELQFNWLTLPVSTAGAEDCPLFVPVLIDKEIRIKVRQKLQENRIFCPLHWPLSKLHIIGTNDRQVYFTELSLLCDQRYNIADMDRCLETLKRIGERI